MAYTAITSAEIATGEPVSATTQNKIKDNLSDHETRLLSLEGGATTTYPPLILRVGGPYGLGGASNGVLITTTNFPIQITGVRLLIQTAGSSGTTEIDLQRSAAGGASFTSMLVTKPSVSYSSGNYALSSNGVVDPANDTLAAGDILRLDLTSVQTGARSFVVRIDYNRA